MRNLILACAVLALSPVVLAEELTEASAPIFSEPIQVMADGVPIAVEAPGFACPTFHDVDGDGLRDLVVGQFKEGKLRLFKNVGSAKAPKFAKGEWLMTGEKAAVVPGVW